MCSNLNRYLLSNLHRNLLPTILGVVVALAFWLTAWAKFPHEGLIYHSLYRFGDLEYWPVIKSLAAGNFSPTYDHLARPDGFWAGPMGAIFPNVFFYSVFGIAGFVVADVVIVVVINVALFRLLMRIKDSPWFALAAVAFIDTAWNLPGLGNLDFYSLRLSRPFVSELWLVLFLGVLFARYSGRAPFLTGSNRLAIWVGILVALLLQSNPNTFLVVAFVMLILAIRDLRLALRDGAIRLWATRYAISAAVFAIGSISFLVMLKFGSPGNVARMGTFRVTDHLGAVSLHLLNAKTALPLAVGLVVLLLLRMPWFGKYRSELICLCLLLFGSFVAQLLYVLLSPWDVEPYHHSIVAFQIAQIGGFILGYIAVCVTAEHMPRLRRILEHRTFVVVPVILVLAYAGTIYRQLGMIMHLREDIFVTAHEGNYRAEFATARRLVDAYAAQHPNTRLLTNDYMMMLWWEMNGYGDIALPDHSAAALSQATLERKWVQAGRALGWSADEFLASVGKDYFGPYQLIYNPINNMFLGGDLYQAWRLHTFAPLDDYPPQFRDRIKTQKNSWQTILPNSEKRRLRTLYEQGGIDPQPLPQVIVLTCWTVWTCAANPDPKYYRAEMVGDMILYFARGATH